MAVGRHSRKRWGGSPQHTLVALIANAWYWLTDGSDRAVRLRQEDFSLGRGLGEWMLVRQTAGAFALSSGQGAVNSLELSLDVARGTSLGLVVTPEHIAATHQDMWRLEFQLQLGALVDSLELDLLDWNRRSLGVRTLHAERSAKFLVNPPGEGSYSLLLTWYTPGGEEAEREVPLPLRSEGVRADG